jgi:myo-inositol-1(or 4)-monophosphatase
MSRFPLRFTHFSPGPSRWHDQLCTRLPLRVQLRIHINLAFLLKLNRFTAVSIGFLYKKQPTIGVIYNPFLDQLYSALKGKGAFLNGTTRLPLHPPGPLTSLSSALTVVEFGSDRSKEIMDLKARSFTRLAGDPEGGVEGGRMGHGLRSIGSAALNYALVASGSLDIYW